MYKEFIDLENVYDWYYKYIYVKGKLLEAVKIFYHKSKTCKNRKWGQQLVPADGESAMSSWPFNSFWMGW